MIVLLKILTLIGMLATVAWFFWNPVSWVFQWAPIASFFIMLAGFFALEKEGSNASEEKQEEKAHPNDVQLFREFLELLPSNTVIEFLKYHDFLADFDPARIDPLRKFIFKWDNSEHIFQDSELEELRKSLMAAGEDLSNKISVNTMLNDRKFLAVRVDRLRDIKEHEERFRKEAKIINDASSEFVRLHQELARKGRQKIDV